jgi:hypothetical protein
MSIEYITTSGVTLLLTLIFKGEKLNLELILDNVNVPEIGQYQRSDSPAR